MSPLLTLARRNVTDRPGRFLLTSAAVLVGVALTVAVFVFTDNLRDTFGGLSQDIETGYDLAVRSEIPFGERDTAAPVSVDLPDLIATVPGVDVVRPRIIEFGAIPTDAEGEAVTGAGPNLGVNWIEGDPVLFLADGAIPQGNGEFALDLDSAADNDMVVGDTYQVLTPAGVREMTLAGTFSFADAEENALVGAVLTAFDTDTAVELLNQGKGFDDVTLTLAGGADPAEVTAALEAVVPDGLEVVSQQDLADEQAAEFNEFIDIFRTILLVFAFVILLVAAFIIYNVFSIIVGQRIQEIGLLRALGATGRQITRSVALEAFLVGAFATVVGIVGGLPIAYGLQKLLASLDFGPDTASTPLRPTTIIVAVLLGVGLTMAAAIWPALRARSVSPMAALRGGAQAEVETTTNPLFGGLLVAAGVLLVVFGFASDQYLVLLLTTIVAGILLHVGAVRIEPRIGRFAMVALAAALIAVALTADLRASMLLALLGASALTAFLGINIISPTFASPAARFLGAPIGRLGIPGRLARENAGRNPQRTATAASALMIGLALVTAVSVVASSLKATFADVLDQAVSADWIVLGDAGPGGGGFSREVADNIAAQPEIADVLPVQWGIDTFRTTADEEVRTVYATALASLEEHFDPNYTDVDPALFGPEAVVVHTDPAEDLALAVGDTVEIQLADLSLRELTVAGIYDDLAIFDSGWVLDSGFWETAPSIPTPQDLYVTAIQAEGVDTEDARAAIESAIASYSQLDAETKDEFQESQEGQIDQVLIVVTVLLYVSVILALLGVAITLALSVFERTREIGLTRAVGGTRRQVKRMVRGEGIIVALFGGVLGVSLGVVFGAACVQIIPDDFVRDLAIPWGSLITYLIVAAVAGLIAAYFPARRASKLNILDAIAHE